MTAHVRAFVGRRPRTARVARASARPWLRTTLASVAAIAAAASLYGVTVARPFALDARAASIEGARYTSHGRIREVLAQGRAPSMNAFRYRTDGLERVLEAEPAVLDAEISVRLPGALHVRVVERQPVMAWGVGRDAFLVDASGRVIARRPAWSLAGARGTPPALVLPTVVDGRASARSLAIGGSVDPVDLAVMRHLGALTPARIGSTAGRITVSVSDEVGWTLRGGTAGWRAILGIYTPTVRPPTVIAAQVQCLRSVLQPREARLETIYLFPGPRTCGTFVERAAPAAAGRGRRP